MEIECEDEPACVALATFPHSQCSVWDCNRRVSREGDQYCCGAHAVRAEEERSLQIPILYPTSLEIRKMDKDICKPILACFTANRNPGIPDISTNVLLKFPWEQPDLFGSNFFNREKCRWWMFLNPYEVEDGKEAIWKSSDATKDGDIDRFLFKPIAGDAELIRAWRLYRFSVVVGGDVKKGLFLMVYKPASKKIVFLTEENQKLVSLLSREQSSTILTDLTFDDIVGDRTKDVLVFFYKPGCCLCEGFAKTYTYLSTLFQNNKDLVFSSIDVSQNTEPRYFIKKHPTLLYFPKDNKAGELIQGGWPYDLEDLTRFIQVKTRFADVIHFDVQAPEPAQIAVAEYPTSQCSRWDCRRRLTYKEDTYCSSNCKIVAERDSMTQFPMLIPDCDLTVLEGYCMKILNCLEGKKNPGVPDITSHVLARYPELQPEMFGKRFFYRETTRSWIFLNPYEVESAIWKLGASRTIVNTVHHTLVPAYGAAGEWTVNRFTVVVHGDVQKGLYLFQYKPRRRITRLAAEKQILSSTRQAVSILRDMDDIELGEYTLVLFVHPGCAVCSSCAQHYSKVLAAHPKDSGLAFASVDMVAQPNLCDKYNVREHPTLVKSRVDNGDLVDGDEVDGGVVDGDVVKVSFSSVDSFVTYMNSRYGPTDI